MKTTAEHIADIWRYVEAVRSGERLACRWERLAVDRFVADIDRQDESDWPWVFDEGKAARVIQFAELFSHVKGPWARLRGRAGRITLEPWQKFFLANLFGWVSRETGLRRINEAYVAVPRKNAKSIMAAIIGLYMLGPEQEPGAEVYCGATSEKQALEVFKPAKLMAQRQPHYARKYGVERNAKSLARSDGSVFAPVIGKPGDGASPSCAILDERHEHPDDDLYDTMATGMGAREEPLLLTITTAGDNLEGPCHRQERECKRVLERLVSNERLFVLIYTVDEDIPWDTEAALIMANPNYGVSVSADYLKHRQQVAMNDPAKAGIFKTKHLNQWVGAMSAWMNMEWWNRQADPDLTRERCKGMRNVVTLDLSSKYDITARGEAFVGAGEDGLTHYYLFGTYYVPKETADDTDNPNHALYQDWINRGHLIATEGDIIDYQVIEDDTIDHCRAFDTETAGYDPWGATQLAQNLDAAQIEIVEIPQTVKQLSEPMKWLHACTKAGRVHHDGNPVLSWMMSNVVAREDRNENVFPNKENRHSKIDGAVAGIMCMSLLMDSGERDDNVYDHRGLISV